MYKQITKIFCWPGLQADIASYIKSCLICQRLRPGLDKVQGYMAAHPVSEVLQKVYMDFWHGSWNNEKVIVQTMIDYGSRWAEAVIVPDEGSETAASVS